MKNITFGLSTLIAFAVFAGLPAQTRAQLPVALGSASNFEILAGAGITVAGAVNSTTIAGDIGTFPTTTITGLGNILLAPGSTNHAGDAVTQLAKGALVTAYNDAEGRLPTTTFGPIHDLGGVTLTPGVYNDPSSFGITGILTLDGLGNPNAVWIFQAGSTLTAESFSEVKLIGSAQAANVFWQVGSSATLKASSIFKGNILALSDITLVTSATVSGRLLARNGFVALDTNILAIPLTAQTITFGAVASHTACDAAFTLSPTASSGLPVTLVVTSGPATIAGNTVTMTGGVGTVVLTASQAGNGTFAAATSVAQSFAVTACVVPLTAQTITFGAVASHTACDAAFTLSPTASSGLPVTLVVTSGPATIAGNTVTFTGGTGTVVLTVSQAGNGTFAAATSVAQSFAVTACVVPPTAQTITFGAVASHTACDAAFTLSPTASSGLPVTLVVTSGPATIAGNTVTMTGGVGTVVLTASQAGNGTFAAATSVAQSFVVTACVVPPTAQTITFGAVASHTACDAAFTLSPTASSGLPVTLVVTSGPATIAGNTVTMTGGVGTVVLTASQAGNGTFAAATSVAQSFAVTACVVTPLPQFIGFQPVPDRGLCDAPFAVNPVATSGLPVTLAVTSGPATVSGNTVTLTGAVGTVVLTASQAGNGTFAAAPNVSQSFAVGPCCVAPVITNNPLTAAGVVGTPFSFTLTASGSPTTFTAFNLPAGLFLNPTTGVISGTPTTPDLATSVQHAAAVGPEVSPPRARWLGPTFVTVTASNGTCVSPSVYLIITIVTASGSGTVPIITNRPLTTSGTLGVPFSFAITASGSPTGYTAFNLPPGLVLNPLSGVISGIPTRDDNVTFVTLSATNATGTGPGVYLMITIGNGSAVNGQPARTTAAMGGSAMFSAGTSGDSAVTYQWRNNGVTLPGATGATLAIGSVQPSDVGFYTVVISSGNNTTTTIPALMELTFAGKMAGSAEEVGSDIHHANGNIYDQVLLTGAAASVKADAGQIVRVSFVDLTDDIVQVEFSGAGVLTINLENPSGPAAPTKYNQPGVFYMKGHASIAITGADATTNVSVFSVGSATAVNQSLFRAGTIYDGWADIALLTVASADGHFGGVRTANANYFRAAGLTGIYAPGVQFSGPVFVGDIAAAASASACLVLGAAADVRITGGDLFQDNGGIVEMSGMTRLQFTAGTSSQGAMIPAQVNRGRLRTNGGSGTSNLFSPERGVV